MKRLGLILFSAMLAQMSIARPILNLNGRSNSPRVDRRAGQFANTCEPASQSADPVSLPILANPLLKVRIWM